MRADRGGSIVSLLRVSGSWAVTVAPQVKIESFACALFARFVPFGGKGAVESNLRFAFWGSHWGRELGGSMGCDDAYDDDGVGRRRRWAGAGAVVGGFAVAASAIILAGGTDVANIPSSAASTTDASPWTPRPGTLPQFFPDMSSEVSGQGTVRSAQESNPVLAWAAKAADAGHDIKSAADGVQSAIAARDIAGAKALCQQMSTANQRLKALLPTPVRALTAEVQGIVDEVDAAAKICLNAGPDTGQAEINSFSAHLNAAWAHYNRAEQIGADNSAPRPRPGLPN
jgi:hypothetical protein